MTTVVPPDELASDPAPTVGATRIAIIDDHEMVLAGLSSWLTHEAPDIDVVITTPTWVDLFDDPAFPVDVALLDLDLRDGIPAEFKIAALAAAGVRVVMISTLAESALVRSSLEAGALSYLPKSEPATEIVHALRAAARGEGYMTPALASALLQPSGGTRHTTANGPNLSPQELRVLVLYASGLPMKSVARTMNISLETAKSYLDRVREKYADAGRVARTKIELHRRALEDGLLTTK
jgi:DNA-binding NarL/FixJ family response regulator